MPFRLPPVLAAGLFAFAVLPSFGQSVSFVDGSGAPALTYLESAQAHVRVVDPGADTNPFGNDTVSVQLSAALTADSEIVTLTETGASTGVFEGPVRLVLGPASPGDGWLETLEDPGPPHRFDTITAVYGAASATAGLAGSRTSFVDAYGRLRTAYAAGSTVSVQVEDHNVDQPGQYDSVLVTLRVPGTGDTEPLQLLETGRNTGIFQGSLPLDPGSGGPGDGRLQASPGMTLNAEHVDGLGYSSSQAQATVAFAAVDFIDEAGKPTADLLEAGTARVRLVYPGGNSSPFSIDSATAMLRGHFSGDFEPVTLTETGADTGVFEGTIDLVTGFGQSDGRLQTSWGPGPDFLPEEVTAEGYDSTATAHVKGSRLAFLDAFGREVTATAVGDRLRLRLIDHTRDNPQARDAVSVQVTALQGGDSEPVMLTETGFHTGVFEGSIATEPGSGSAPNTLQVNPGVQVEGFSPNTNSPEATRARVQMTGSSVLFVDAQGQPVVEYLESSQAYLRVVSGFANFNPSAPDTATVRVQTALTGDVELVTLTETGANTGIFTGGIALRLGPGSIGDGFVETMEAPGPPHEFDLLTATFDDPFGSSLVSAGLTGSRTSFVDAYGAPVTSYPIGARVYVRVEDHNFDQPGLFDTVQAMVRVPGGDVESIQLLETGKNTGVFLGSLLLEPSPSSYPGDGKLQVSSPGTLFEAEHIDALGQSSSKAQAITKYAGIAFIDASGNPTVELLEAGTARVRLFYPGANSSPFSIDSTTAMLRSRFAGDSEPVQLTETGADTGVFEGTIDLVSGFGQSDGRLQTSWGPGPDFLPEEVTAEGYDSTATAHVKGSRLAFLDAFGREVTATAVGDRLRLRLIDHTRDNPQSRDTVSVQVTALQGGDSEPVMLTETGFHTGVFEGSIATEPGSGSAPGTLQVNPGAQVEGFSPNTNSPEPARARVQMTGSSVLFVDAQGQPVAEYLESSRAYLRAVSGFANFNPSAPDTATVRVQTALTGDVELVTLTETGANTGIFTGGIALRLGPGAAGDGFVETMEAPGPPHEFDLLTATFDDPFGSSMVSAGLTGSWTSFVDAYGAPVSSYPIGGRIYVRVEDHNFDQPGMFDTVQATVRVPGGDAESIQLLETGKSTGVFLGSLLLESSSSSYPGDGKLQVYSPGTLFEAEHVDALGQTSSKAQAITKYARIDFIDASGNPTIELLEAGTARVRLFYPGANSSPFSIDSATAMLRSRFAGDSEPVQLTETGADTGVFEGTIDLVSGFGQSDGRLQTSWGPGPDFLPEEVTAEGYDSTATAHVKGSRLAFLDAFGREVAATAVGDRLRLRLIDHTRDNPQSRDTVSVQVTALQGGDSEPVTLTETGFHTGVFEGSIATEPGSGSAPATLQVNPGDQVEGFSPNTNSPEATRARVQMTGSSVLFVDAQGQPVAEYLESSQAYLRVVSGFANFNPSAPDTATVRVQTALTGDVELVTLTETGANTGIFTGGIALRLGPGSIGDGFVETMEAPGPPHEFDLLTATFDDPSGSSLVSAGLTGSRTSFVDAYGAPVSSYPIGARVYVRVEDHNFDQPGLFDTVQATVRVPGGDVESIQLLETGKNTGVFIGSLLLESSPSSYPGDGRLQVYSPGTLFEAEHIDALGQTSSKAQAITKYAGIAFIDASGNPTVELLEAGTARVRLFYPGANSSPFSIDSTTAMLRSRFAGDSEPVQLTETGADTGVFEGTIDLVSGFGQSDGRLQTSWGPGPDFLPEEVTAEGYDSTATAHVKGSRLAFLDAFGREVTATAVGDRLRLRLIDHTRDNPQSRDTVSVQVTALQGGDSEPVTLTETGFHTGVFEGSIATEPGSGSAPATLQVNPGDQVEGFSPNTNSPEATRARVQMTGSSVLFVDAQGQPVAEYLESSQAYLRVVSGFANFNPSAPDTATVRVQTALTGDVELVTLTETGANTGIFTGGIALRLGPGAAGDGFVETQEAPGPPHEFDLLTATFDDPFGSSLVSAGLTGSRTSFVDVYGAPVTSYPIGARIYVQVEDHNFDQPGQVDTVQATVRVQGADVESVQLTETGPQTGLFRGSLLLESSPNSYPGDGKLQVYSPGVVFEAEHIDALGMTSSKAQAISKYARIDFIDASGNPTSEVLEAGTARVRVFYPGANSSPFSIDSTTAMLRSRFAGDSEPVTLTETGADTNIFEGTITLATGPAQADGRLQTFWGPAPDYLPEEVTAESYDSTATAHVVGSRAWFLNLRGQVVTTYALRSAVRVRVENPVADNPGQVDTLPVLVRSLGAGDEESLTLTETGAATGIFEGTLPSTDAPTSQQNGTLTAGAGEVIELVSPNLNSPEPARVRATFLASAAPQAVSDTAQTLQDAAVTVSVLANDSGAPPLSVGAVSQAAHGTVAANADGTVTYTPAAGYFGPDAFTYVLVDGQGGEAQAGVAVTVTPSNRAPVATNDTATVAEDGTVNVAVLANDTDPDNDTLSVTAVTQGAHGAVAINPDKTVKLTPTANYNGPDSFTYTIDDGHSHTATATVSVTVTSVNDAPVAVADSASVAEDGTVNVNVLANDTDPENDTLSVTSVTQGAHGAVVINPDKTVKYTPAANYSGSDTFTYTISDGNGGSATGTVTMTVTAVNDAPVAVADSASVAEDGTIDVPVLSNDTDPENDTLTVTAVTQGAHGAVVINPDKTVKYTPAANYNGSDTFTYTVSDGNGGSATGTVTMTVTAVNDAPVAVADSASVAEDGTVNVNVLSNDTDVENDTLTVTAVTQGAHGAVVINPDKTVKYTPAANYSGSDTFTYTVSDGNGGSATGTVTMTVTAVNDAPVAVADSASVAEDGTIDVPVLSNDTDPENDTLTVTAVTQGAHGAVVINPDKTVKYTPAANYNGSDTFTYTVSDGNGGSATGTVTMTVTAVNDAPVAFADSASVAEDGTVNVNVLGNDTDVENDTLSVTAVTQGAHGAVVINPDKTVKYTPAANYNGPDTFTYTVSDGNGGSATGTVTMTVTAVNDAPVAVADSASVAEDGTVNVNVLGNDTDVENDTLSVTAVTQGAHGAVVINPDKTVKYTPAANYNGSDTFTYTISDGNGGSATGTVTMTVTAVNDAPVAAADSASVAEDGTVNVNVLGNDTDVENDTLTVTAVTQGAHGAVVINPDKTVKYTPAANYNGSDAFIYTVSDGHGGAATASVSIIVTAVNDAPVAVADSASVAEDGTVNVNVLSNDTDPENDTLTVTAVTQGAHGAVVINPDKTVKYTPAANYNGSDTFTYTVSDGHGGSATASVSIIVTAVNDAPVAVNDTASTVAEVATTVSVLANDVDVDSPTLLVTSVTQGAHGTVAINAGQTAVTYTPAANWIGPDSFTYTISDGAGGSATATVSVTVQAPPRVGTNLQVLYPFSEGSGTTVHDTSGVGTALDLTIGSAAAVSWSTGSLSFNSATLAQSAGNATKVITAVQASNALTVEAWVTPKNLTQTGPAAIVAISQTSNKRDITLGQTTSRYDARLRTSNTNNAGTSLTTSTGVVTTGLQHVVFTRDAAGNARTYVNGTQVATGTMSGNLSSWVSYKLGLGDELAGGNSWLGTYHLVAIYSRALTAAEIHQNFLAGKDGN